MQFNKLLKKLRTGLGLSQRQLETDLKSKLPSGFHCPVNIISLLERGLRQNKKSELLILVQLIDAILEANGGLVSKFLKKGDEDPEECSVDSLTITTKTEIDYLTLARLTPSDADPSVTIRALQGLVSFFAKAKAIPCHTDPQVIEFVRLGIEIVGKAGQGC